MVRSRSLRAVGRSRLDAAVRAAAPHRLRRSRSTTSSSSASGAARRRVTPSGTTRRASRRRPVRSGRARQRGRHGDRGALPRDARSTGPGHAIIDHHTYALVSDGDVMEGVALRGREPRGPPRARQADLPLRREPRHARRPARRSSMSEDVGARFAAYGWHVQHVERRRHTTSPAIDAAIAAAKAETDAAVAHRRATRRSASARRRRPARARRTARRSATPRSPRPRRRSAGIPSAKFLRPRRGARAHGRGAASAARRRTRRGDERFAAYKRRAPRARRAARARDRGRAAGGLGRASCRRSTASRSRRARPCGKVHGRARARRCRGCSAATPTSAARRRRSSPGGNYDRAGDGRNLRFGIREHAMGAIGNGMLYHGGCAPYVATFFVFSDYMRPTRAARGAQQACRRSSCGRTTRSASARTARRTSRSST